MENHKKQFFPDGGFFVPPHLLIVPVQAENGCLLFPSDGVGNSYIISLLLPLVLILQEVCIKP